MFKKNNELELRMYSLVMYNLSDIQKGIQAGHSWVEYAKDYYNDRDFQSWMNRWKTVIILNGGTSNNIDVSYKGTMESHLEVLKENGVKVSTFYEPDLNNSLSSISFLVDERVFNRREYMLDESLVSEFGEEYLITILGSKQNIFLREYLENLKLA
jgi:hypothetical protein